jgi:hypothetical protein
MQPLGIAAVSRLSSEEVYRLNQHWRDLEIRLFWLFRRGSVGSNVRKRSGALYGRMLRLRRCTSQQRPDRGRSPPDCSERQDIAPLKRKSDDHRRPVRRNQRTDRWIFSFEARDMDEAVRLVSNHPGLKAGPFEIRPVEDMTEMIRESKRRRSEDGRK